MFSSRYGINTASILQKDNIDTKLKIDLWNTFQKYFLDKVYYSSSYSSNKDYYSNLTLQSCYNYTFLVDLYENFFIYPIGNMLKCSLSSIKKKYRKVIFGLKMVSSIRLN